MGVSGGGGWGRWGIRFVQIISQVALLTEVLQKGGPRLGTITGVDCNVRPAASPSNPPHPAVLQARRGVLYLSDGSNPLALHPPTHFLLAPPASPVHRGPANPWLQGPPAWTLQRPPSTWKYQIRDLTPVCLFSPCQGFLAETSHMTYFFALIKKVNSKLTNLNCDIIQIQ